MEKLKKGSRHMMLIFLGTIFIFSGLFLSGCSPYIYKTADKPVLYMQIGRVINDVRIVKDNDTEVEITSGTLDIYPNTVDDDNGSSAGYTFYLETGASYKAIRYFIGSSAQTKPINIDNAEPGIVYFVSF
jgi:hypothetical protein